MKKVYYTHSDMNNMYTEVIRGMSQAQYRPDCVIGLSRGGLDFAVKISHWYDIPMHCLEWQTRDGKFCDRERLIHLFKQYAGKSILIVDDILDSGTTMHDIANTCDLADGKCYIDFAVAILNTDTDFDICWHGSELSRSDDDSWIVFPWENWWVQ